MYLDLDAQNRTKSGVVIDIRNNSGGFVNAYVLDVLARRPYLTMTDRGGPAAPARTMLGQRSLELPTILVVNQHSLSDAEDFTEGYRTLKLGKVVGEPTAGWIIYTGSRDLVDGSVMRLPGTLITGADGKNMENNPRPVDIAGDAADRRVVFREGFAVGRGGEGAAGGNEVSPRHRTLEAMGARNQLRPLDPGSRGSRLSPARSGGRRNVAGRIDLCRAGCCWCSLR